MTELDYGRAILLGVIQGFTEFIPVSSSGHLVLAQRWLGLDADGAGMLLFDVLAHVATLIAMVLVFAPTVKRFARRLIAESRAQGPRRRHARHVLLMAVTACAITGSVGLMFKGSFEAAFDNPTLVGAGLLITGALLAGTAFVKGGRRGWSRFGWWQAALVGLAQAGAILPGISRSGSTICVASFCGLRRRWTTQFSFLIAVPPILGAAMLKVGDTLALPAEQLARVAWGPIAVGSAVSLGTGIVALRLLLSVVNHAKLHYFAPYCWLLGAWVLLASA